MLKRATVTSIVLLFVTTGAEAAPSLGFLVPKTPVDSVGPETAAAWTLARKQGAVLVVAKGAGKFTREDGQPLLLDDVDVLWFHQGDSVKQTPPIYETQTLDTLRRFVAGGHGLYLSGAALGLVHALRVEPVSPRRGGPGKDDGQVGLTPAVPKHPIFKGLKFDGRTVRLSNRGFPAFGDFHGAGPTKGMLLADASPNGGERPVVEYALGKGRIVVVGWRLPHYSHAANPHRANLERLTVNILAYLATPNTWQKMVIKPYRQRRQPKTAGQDYVNPALDDQHVKTLRLAIEDLIASFGDRYPKGKTFLARLDALMKAHEAMAAEDMTDEATTQHSVELTARFRTLRREALMANPLLSFDKLLLIQRDASNLALPANWQSNSSIRATGHNNAMMALSLRSLNAKMTPVFRPEGGRFVGDIDLHWDANRMLVSMPGENGRWQVCEIQIDPKTGTMVPDSLRELPLIAERDVDNYDACYLPDGNILFTSTAPFVGVPCVKGSSHVSNLFLYETKTSRIRQLAFDQDHDWCPTVLNNGRVLYLRWEYSGIPHFVSRILFHCNPDGTEQMEYYGSNSYWPNSTFFARPIPNHPTMIVGVVSGHHDTRRMGELILFDPAKGRREATGVVQRIPGRGEEVEPIIRDGLVRGSWPKFLHPWPLSDKYFIVASQPTAQSWWGIYLVDVFDNMLLLREEPFAALMEPIPLAVRPMPPVVLPKIEPDSKDAVIFMADVYQGPGLKGVPRGTVKKLRLFTYHFAYHGMGGQVNRVGLDGPWDVKRIIGTVPVEPDGSAYFQVPANVPISIQPLDAEGKALQLMRSWMTAMPGEVLSCVGCHERQNTSVPNRNAQALRKAPAEITSWYGPTRGFAFVREVQPVLDAHCVRCHDGKEASPDFTARPPVHPQAKSQNYNNGTKFTPSYIALRSYVRTPSIESDIHLLEPGEFHADTTRLVQMLKKGHYGVQLDAEGWDRIVTWIDLNAPAHGTWHEIVGEALVERYRERRMEMFRRYAGRDDDPEAIHPVSYNPHVVADKPTAASREAPTANLPGWPFDAAEAQRRQKASGQAVERDLELGGGITMTLVRVPAGEFAMGSSNGPADESPTTRTKISRPFWMGKTEVTNEQFALFDAEHDSRLESGDFLQFSTRERGYPVNTPLQPVCRVSWQEAMAFCRWLSEKTGESFVLPTESQWEWACRAGTATDLWWGKQDADFANLANLADHSLRFIDTFGWKLPSGAVPPWRPAIESVNDGHRVSAPVGSYQPNPWGLHDMHGNVSEWTRSAYRPYPTGDKPGADVAPTLRRVVRGGSWYDRPQQARSSWRLDYPAWQGVYDVGFRVIAVEVKTAPQ